MISTSVTNLNLMHFKFGRFWREMRGIEGNIGFLARRPIGFRGKKPY